jgi:hypothetical protein
VGVVSDAGNDRNLQGRNYRGAVWSPPGIQGRPGFKSARVDPSHAGAAAVRDQNAAFSRNDAGCSWKALQRC